MLDELDLRDWATEALVALAQRGDDAAYRQLHQRYSDRLLRGLRLSVPPDLAEDAAQEAWVRAYERLSDLDQPSAFFSWLATIARNSARSVLRGPQRRDVQLADNEQISIDRLADPYQAAEMKEREDAARSALNKLPSRQRQALEMRCIDGRSYQQIAAITGESVSAIETLLYRARSNFHRRYESSLSGVEASDDVACYKIRSHIRRLGEGQLSERRRSRVLNHLDRCSRCRTVHEELGEKWQSRGWLPLPFLPVPAGLRDLLASLSARLGAFSGQTLAPAQLAGGAALAVTVGLAVTTLGPLGPQAQPDDFARAEASRPNVSMASTGQLADSPIADGGQSRADSPQITAPVSVADSTVPKSRQAVGVAPIVSASADDQPEESIAAPADQPAVGAVKDVATTLLNEVEGPLGELTSAVTTLPVAEGALTTLDEVVSTTGGIVSSLAGELLP